MSIALLSYLQRDLSRTTRRCAAEAVEEERAVTEEIEGVKVELRYEGTQGRGSVSTWSGVFLNGERYGVEHELIPYSVFKDPSVWYYVGGLMSMDQASRILAAAGVGDVSVVEEDYPPLPPAPPRYYFVSRSLESVVKLWLAEREELAKNNQRNE
jgi:hypothetical protein